MPALDAMALALLNPWQRGFPLLREPFDVIAAQAGMTVDEVRDNLLTFIVAGHETTALTLAWSLYLCAHAPAIQARARTEAQAAFLRTAVHKRQNILIAGGTSTGKTTLANALLDEIAATGDRVIVLEDTVEHRVRQVLAGSGSSR